ncbi:MAG: hypothetical protein EON93_24860, partial [Burkholderiales bacterium]
QTPCRVILDQGRGIETVTVTHPLGDVSNPMNREQVMAKFERLARDTVAPGHRRRIASALDGLEAEGFRPLWSALECRHKPDQPPGHHAATRAASPIQ